MENINLYNKYLQGQHWYDHPVSYAEEFANLLQKQGFKGRIIDIGSGSGRDVHFFKSLGFEVKGLDYSEDEIKRAQASFPQDNFIVGDAEKLDLLDNSVGAVFMINVIHYVNQKKSLEEIHRVLCDRGYFFIHFNLAIKNIDGNIDYQQNEAEIRNSIKAFNIISEKKFSRLDRIPSEHTHNILQFILQK
jgi:ubiquinone/menaquinone biosynthesis C-methylase UbiE